MKKTDQYQYLGNCPPTPNPTLTVVELGEGQVGSCPDNDIDPKKQCNCYLRLFCDDTNFLCKPRCLFLVDVIFLASKESVLETHRIK